MRARFVILNVMFAAILAAAWRAGFLEAFPSLGWQELAMIGALGIYGCLGVLAALFGKWDAVNHFANGAPILGLAMTGLGLLLAVQGIHDLNPAALATTFRAMVEAITPNIAAVAILFWLRELEAWCSEAR